MSYQPTMVFCEYHIILYDYILERIVIHIKMNITIPQI